jgi:hypothetical protein
MSDLPDLTIQVADINRSQQLFTLYAKKGAFELSEYSDVGNVYNKLTKALEDANGAKEATVNSKEVAYVLSAINVCSQRTPVEIANYKTIATLFETFGEALKGAGVKAEEPESKRKAD